MRILGLDVETTGLDLKKDRVLKLGAILYDTEKNRAPLFEFEWGLWHDSYPPIQPDAYQVHSLEQKSCAEFGLDPERVLRRLVQVCERHGVTTLLAHNGNQFDFPMLFSMCDAFATNCLSFFQKSLKIDTMTDVLYPETIQTRKLTHLAAEHGFVNPFPHSSLSDIRTMFEIFFRYPLDETLKRARSPQMTIGAMVDFHSRDLAKARRFSWDGQRWIKKIKECDLDKEKKEAKFEVIIL